MYKVFEFGHLPVGNEFNMDERGRYYVPFVDERYCFSTNGVGLPDLSELCSRIRPHMFVNEQEVH